MLVNTELWEQVLSVKTGAKKDFSTSVISVSSFIHWLSFSLNFLFQLMCLYNLSLPYASLSSFSSRPTFCFDHPDFVATAFILKHCWAILLYSSFLASLCFRFFYSHVFLWFCSWRSSWHNQAGLLPEFLVFLYNRMVCSWALKKFSLKISQLSWAPFPFMAASQGTLPSNSLKISQSLLSWNPEC